MASPVFRLTGNGIINLVNKTLDYHAKPKLVGTLIGQGDTVAARKGLAVPIRITGPFSSPKLSLDVDLKSLMRDPEAIRETIRGAKETIRNLKQPLKGGDGGVREKIKKGLGGLLRKGM
jgi:AsmA protein